MHKELIEKYIQDSGMYKDYYGVWSFTRECMQAEFEKMFEFVTAELAKDPEHLSTFHRLQKVELRVKNLEAALALLLEMREL